MSLVALEHLVRYPFQSELTAEPSGARLRLAPRAKEALRTAGAVQIQMSEPGARAWLEKQKGGGKAGRLVASLLRLEPSVRRD